MSAVVVPEPVRPRLPPEVARAMSKLAGRAHRFHRWAHHPLCGAYRGEVIALGHRVRVCRGCSFVAGGLVLGAAVGFAVPYAAVLPLVGLAMLAVSSRFRLPKWLGRFAPAVLIGASLSSGLLGAAVGAVSAAVALLAYRGRAPNRAPCVGCPQRELKVCDGVRPIVRRERAVMRFGSRLVRRATSEV
ncbi:MAG: hypothetical protein QM723_14180 [Myxococcaceae bacterium]